MNALLVRIRVWILEVLRVPSEPQAPAGSPGSLRVFRAGASYSRILFWGWVGKQFLLILPFVFWIGLGVRFLPEEMTLGSRRKGNLRKVSTAQFREWLLMFEVPFIALGLLQMPFTYVLMRLRYEQHWYMVTDRSLRIREGITTVRETTLGFANIQNIAVNQNPFQRLFGLSNVEVKSAGGGSVGHQAQGQSLESWHTAVFRNVDNPEEIRDLILRHQRALKETGLGDPEEQRRAAAPSTTAPAAPMSARHPDDLAAARELLAETRRLREALGVPSRE
jgi:hypothetical protein